jgi:pimeloyl-ACP methyl ester carboxylesterase
VFGLFQKLGLAGRVHPLAPGARRRRRTFASPQAMFDRYRRTPVFSRLDDAALSDYVDAALRPAPDGALELAYSPEWEARIYETGPLNLWGELRRLQPPVLVIRGSESDTFRLPAVRALRRRLPKAVVREVAGAGHLVPLERPDETARFIREFLADLTPPAA